jgi:hypothetical protein
MKPTLFSPDSFWNQPLPADPVLDPESALMVAAMQRRWGEVSTVSSGASPGSQIHHAFARLSETIWGFIWLVMKCRFSTR